jgi:HSP20 family protein
MLKLTKYNNNKYDGLNALVDSLGINNFFGDDFYKNYFHNPYSNEENTTLSPKMNVKENDNSYLIDAEVPGFEKDEISVNLEENVLKIHGEKSKETESGTENSKSHRIEFHAQKFSRSYRLPKSVVKSKITANYKNGILSVEIPKSKKPDAVKIKVN